MVKTRTYVVKKYFEGMPKREDFEVVENELPALQTNEILVKTEWISVDPFQRVYNNILLPVPFEQFGFQVGIVEDSRDPSYPVGTRIISFKGWCDYYIANTKDEAMYDFLKFNIQKLPDLEGLSPSLSIGSLGLPGATAYFGFLEICKPNPGDTVVVTGSAGAVGSLVGQIAKIKGCKVIGFAGSDEKVEFLEKELGFDKAFNYKTVDVHNALKQAAPNGVDCYFDNVGGEISSIIMNNMNNFGRVAVCGCVSSYNDLDSPKASLVQPAIFMKELKIEGFVVKRWLDRWPKAFADIHKWISSGELKVKEHITQGFDNIYGAFIGMLNGENIGKAIVKV